MVRVICSLSAVSKPNFARKYALESSRRDLHNALLCKALKSRIFLKNAIFSEILLKTYSDLLIFIVLAKFAIAELCKGVHCVDLGESFQTQIYVQNLDSIPPRTSPDKFAVWLALASRDMGSFLSEVHAKNPRFGVIKTNPKNFIVIHFAGPVEYTSTSFVEKNPERYL